MTRGPNEPSAPLRLWASAMLFFAPCALAPAAVALADQQFVGAAAFMVSALVGSGLGLVGRRGWSLPSEELPRPFAMRTVAGIWLSLSLVAAAPFLVYGQVGNEAARLAYGTPWQAWFEAMSGLTSTGLSMSSKAASLPGALQLWRSLLQWVGGFSVVAFLALVVKLDDSAAAPLDVELDVPLPLSGLGRRTRSYLGLYIGMTVVAGLAFLAVGVAPWTAFNHGLTSIATGGFSVTSDSFASYGTGPRLVALVATLAGALSFKLHYDLFIRRKPSALLHSYPLRLFAAMVLGGGGVVALLAVMRGDVVLADALFDWISAVGTCGYTVAGSHAHWPSVLLAPLAAAMVVGGMSGSTSGGFKQDRVVWLLAAAARIVRRKPRHAPYVFGDEEVEGGAHETAHVAGHLVIWLAILTTASLVLIVALPSAGVVSIVFDVTSALGGVGLDAGFISGQRPGWVLALFTVLMWLGRLELLAVLVLLVPVDRPHEEP